MFYELIWQDLVETVAALREIGDAVFVVVTVGPSWALRRMANGWFDSGRDSDLIIPGVISIIFGCLIEASTPGFNLKVALMRVTFNAFLSMLIYKPSAFTAFVPTPLILWIPDTFSIRIPVVGKELLAIPTGSFREWVIEEAKKRSWRDPDVSLSARQPPGDSQR